MFLVGLTGNYGTGKSTVLKMFRDLGARTYDADEIVASLLREEEVIKKITNLFGNTVFHVNGGLDKKKIAALIFSDSTLRRSLEDILHPLVFRKIADLLEHEGGGNDIVVIETPLLFERAYESRFQRIITVKTDQKKALDRLEKNGIKREDAMNRIQSQLPAEEKFNKSDFIVTNNGTLKRTDQQVKDIYKKLLHEVSHGDRCRS